SSSRTHDVFRQRKEKYLGKNIANLLFCRLSADGGLLSLFLCSSGLVVALIGVYQGKRKEYKDKVLLLRILKDYSNKHRIIIVMLSIT
ncbi:hypothetical protein, partial [Streptomyces sundarbansensis]